MKIIKAEKNNAQDVYNIIKSCADDMAKKGLHHWLPYYKIENIKQNIDNQKVYIVEDEGSKIIATFTLDNEIPYTMKDLNEENSLYLSKLAVLPSYSNKGIGSKCIQFIEKYAKENKYKYIKFDVYNKSEQTIKFYQKNGYEVFGKANTRRFEVLLMQKEVR